MIISLIIFKMIFFFEISNALLFWSFIPTGTKIWNPNILPSN
jgi:hypothetical protein